MSGLRHQQRRALNHALSQQDRARRTPAPERVPVDGRPAAQLQGFAADYGTLIRFYDLANRPDGDWSAFFLSDPTIAQARAAGLDLAQIEAELLSLPRALSAAAAAPRLAAWSKLSRALPRLAGFLDGAVRTPDTFSATLAALASSGRDGELAEAAGRLAYLLGVDDPLKRLANEGAGSAWLARMTAQLEALIGALMLALAPVPGAAAASLQASLQAAGHPPQGALWNAFVQLFGHAQASINRFPRRLIDFYQSAVLRQNERAGRADQLLLVLTPSGADPAPLARATRFDAGADADGLPIAYQLDDALTVQPTAVTSLRTVTVSTQPPVAGAAPAPARVFGAAIAPANAAPAPLFGSTTDPLASMGFAVASDCLLLAGGRRDVHLRITPAAASYARLLPLLETVGRAAGGMAAPAVLAGVLEGAFALCYSSAGGWIEIASYAVSPPAGDDEVYTLSFTLGADAEAWTAWPEPAPFVPDGRGPYVDMPTLRAVLRQEQVELGTPPCALYPYALLADLAWSALELRVGVAGLSDLQLTGAGAALDPSQPFALFGPVPVQYAALTVSAPELFAKRLTSFGMTIDWSGLPVTVQGFEGYYKAYVIGPNGQASQKPWFKDDSFTVGLEVINPGQWALQQHAPYLALFQTECTPSQSLAPQSQLSQPVVAHRRGPYYDPARSAVQLRLQTPSYAFGDVLYGPNVMAATLDMSATAAACVHDCASHPGPQPDCVQNCLAAAHTRGFPNPPWQPLASALRVCYAASALLLPDARTAEARYFHIAPFDVTVEAEATSLGAIALLQPLPAAGSLEIGLSACVSSLSLLLELAQPAAGWPTATPPPRWQQADGGGAWRPLQPLSDGSGGMRQTGIVRFAPDAAPDGAASQPLRLRVQVDSHPADYPLLVRLSPNAASATWCGPGGAMQLDTPLPAGTISALAAPRDDIGTVEQPLASTGGRSAERGTAFDRWLAERLHHKDDAIQADDYATLVLAEFPSLWQAGVVAASNGAPGEHGGQVWIVPVPGPDAPGIADPTVPASDGQLLAEIAAFLTPRVSPFLQLNVTNPPYVRLRVEAELRFTGEQAAEACIARLNADLIAFLSPWLPSGLDERPADYYQLAEVAYFIRQRPYVRSILKIRLVPEQGAASRQRYYTSALKHVLHATAVADPPPARAPRLALPPAQQGPRR